MTAVSQGDFGFVFSSRIKEGGLEVVEKSVEVGGYAGKELDQVRLGPGGCIVREERQEELQLACIVRKTFRVGDSVQANLRDKGFGKSTTGSVVGLRFGKYHRRGSGRIGRCSGGGRSSLSSLGGLSGLRKLRGRKLRGRFWCSLGGQNCFQLGLSLTE